jgi:uncharacterized protein YjgD (DUF1641 family)
MQASGALERIAVTLPKLMERLESVEHVLGSLEAAVEETSRLPAPSGGVVGTWQVLRDPQAQRSLQLLQNFGKHLGKSRR